MQSTPTPTGERFLNVKEVAVKLGNRGIRTIFRYAKNGTIPAGSLLGGSRVWREKDIDTFIATPADSAN